MIQQIISFLLRIRRVYIMTGLLFVTVLTLFWAVVFDAPRNFPVGETVTIPQGVTTEQIADILYKENVIESKKLYIGLTRFFFNSNKLKAGDYFFSNKVGPIIVLNTVPGNEPIEKQAKNIPDKDLSNKK